MSPSEMVRGRFTHPELVELMPSGSRWMDEKGQVWMVLKWYDRYDDEKWVPSRVDLACTMFDRQVSVDIEKIQIKIKHGNLTRFTGVLHVLNKGQK